MIHHPTPTLLPDEIPSTWKPCFHPRRFFESWIILDPKDGTSLADCAENLIRYRLPHTALQNALHRFFTKLNHTDGHEEKLRHCLYFFSLRGRQSHELEAEEITRIHSTLQELHRRSQAKFEVEAFLNWLSQAYDPAGEKEPLRYAASPIKTRLLPLSVSDNVRDALFELELTGRIAHCPNGFLVCEACSTVRADYLFEATNPQTCQTLLIGTECAASINLEAPWMPNDETITRASEINKTQIEYTDLDEEKHGQRLSTIFAARKIGFLAPEEAGIRVSKTSLRNAHKESKIHVTGCLLQIEGQLALLAEQNKKTVALTGESILPIPLENFKARHWSRKIALVKNRLAALQPFVIQEDGILLNILQRLGAANRPATAAAFQALARFLHKDEVTPEEWEAIATTLKDQPKLLPPAEENAEVLGLRNHILSLGAVHYYTVQARKPATPHNPEPSWRQQKRHLIQDLSGWNRAHTDESFNWEVTFPEINQTIRYTLDETENTHSAAA